MSGRRAFGMAAVLVLLTAGCGVQPSGVIKGASPPSGRAQPGTSVTLYLVVNGELTPVRRSSGPLSRAATLALLASGPTQEERAHGLTSEVPRDAAPFTVSMRPLAPTAVTVSGSVDRLSDTAIDQIVCTAAEPGERVTVVAGRESPGPGVCPVPG